CLELIRLRDQPLRQLPAVAHSFDSHPLAVNPQISPHRRAHAVQHILPLVAVLIAEDRVSEFLTVAGRAAEVDVKNGVSVRTVDLIAPTESGAVLSVRAAVNINDERMF